MLNRSILCTHSPLHCVSLAPSFSGLVDELPPDVDTVPSMMSVGERRVLYNLVDRHWTGSGLIIDAGILCGASTALFGRAAKKRAPTRRGVIVSIEQAIAISRLVPFLKKHLPDYSIEDGDSFAPLIERCIADVRDLVDLRIGDIKSIGGGVTKPIEVLFLDVLKERSIADFCMRNYFPRLFAGAFVLQQDYLIDSLPYIREQNEYLCAKGYLTYIGELGPMAVFQCRRRPSQEDCEAAAEDLPYELVVRLLSASEQRSIDPYRRALCALARVWRAAEMRDRDEARAVLAGLRQTYAAQVEKAPRRLLNALDAAEYLCATDWSLEAADKASLISVGHASFNREPQQAI